MAKLLLNTDAVLTLIVLLIDVIVVQGQTQEGNESKSVKNNFQVELTQKLFTNRSLVVPPYTYNADSSFNPINISLHTHIWSVSDIDLRHQRFTFTGWFVVQYTDPSLSWDTTVYPVDAIFVKPEDIWTPELYVTNSLMPYDQLVKQQMPVWLFYALNVLLPVLLVSALNSVVFALPVQCGEKMSVSLTTFLTLAVFMTLIQDSLPSNSDTVCYLAVYLGAQLQEHMLLAGSPKLDRSKGRGQTNVDHLSKRLNGFA
nr:hypothetical protein BaRGS_003827 [Batillaria attramentaria]